MSTIIQRRRKDGTIGYTAQVVIKRGGKVAYRKAQTFDREQAAKAWIAKVEKAINKPGGLESVTKPNGTLGDAIDKYTKDSVSRIGRTKAQVLRSIKKYSIADMDCASIESAQIVDFAKELSESMTPQTVSNYLSHLSAVFAIAKGAWNMPLNYDAIKEAMRVTKRLGLTGKSVARDRRPTMEELDAIMEHFIKRSGYRRGVAPMHKIVAFAIFSTRRQEEITRIRWDDFDEEHSRVLVRDMKNPGDKIGNNVWCDLPDPAVKIIKSMPKVADEIFPYGTDAISAAFTRACRFLKIQDLRFHDLRHEGVSRLFEMGQDIPHVAIVSGHRSWSSLKRYSHIRQSGDRFKDWKWLPVVTVPDETSQTAHPSTS